MSGFNVHPINKSHSAPRGGREKSEVCSHGESYCTANKPDWRQVYTLIIFVLLVVGFKKKEKQRGAHSKHTCLPYGRKNSGRLNVTQPKRVIVIQFVHNIWAKTFSAATRLFFFFSLKIVLSPKQPLHLDYINYVFFFQPFDCKCVMTDAAVMTTQCVCVCLCVPAVCVCLMDGSNGTSYVEMCYAHSYWCRVFVPQIFIFAHLHSLLCSAELNHSAITLKWNNSVGVGQRKREQQLESASGPVVWDP